MRRPRTRPPGRIPSRCCDPSRARAASTAGANDAGDHYPELVVTYTPGGGFAAPAPDRPATAPQLGGLRLLGERDLDGDGAPDLLLRGRGGALLGGRATPSGLLTWELALDRDAQDPLAVLVRSEPR